MAYTCVQFVYIGGMALFSSFIGRVDYTGFILVVLLYASLCSVVLMGGWSRWLVFCMYILEG